MSENVSVKGLKELHRTEAAILFERPDGSEEWIPRSLIDYICKSRDEICIIEIPEWLARNKNLDYD
jgi:hypothetical protein